MMKSLPILLVDDDPDDSSFTIEAFRENHVTNEIIWLKDGELLMDYLYRRGQYSHLTENQRPSLILLDLNMPRKDGMTALKEIKSDPDLKEIPVVVFTTSKAEEDICRSYALGVNSFITKPFTLAAFTELIGTLNKYWFETVELPLNSHRTGIR